MAFVNGLICMINVVILFMVIGNVREIQNSIQHDEKVKSDIKALLKENTDLATAIIDELEKKITVAEGFKEYLDSKEQAAKEESVLVEEKSKPHLEGTAARIIHLKESGLSNEDIAEELGVSQGEIDLQIKLHNKKGQGLKKEEVVGKQ